MLSFMCSLQADHHHLLASSASAMGFHQEGEMKQWLSFFFHCVSNSAVGNFPSSLFINTGRLFLIKRKKKVRDPIVVYIFIAINELIIEFLTFFVCVYQKANQAAAAAAQSLQSCPTLCNPRDGRLPASPVPGILQARTLEWAAISFFTNQARWHIYWRRQWHPTPVLLPGTSHRQRSLVGCSPWGR